MTFQIIALNSGTEKWINKKYYFEVEIYNLEKKYITKTDKVRGKTDVATGETTLVYVHFNIPPSYENEYLYRITLTINEQKIIPSQYNSFTVIPLAKAAPKVSKISIGGNAILSWKQTQKSYEIYGSSSDYTGSLNLNMVGKVYDSPISLNLYTRYTKEDGSDLDNFLFSFYGKVVQIAFGDIQPAFNSLVLYGAGVRGLQLSSAEGESSASMVVAESAEKIEGTADTNGTYERYLWGCQIKQSLGIANSYITGAYMGSQDDHGSLDIPGPSLLAVKNTVVGASAYTEPISQLGVNCEYAHSTYWADISSAAVRDYGLRTTLTLMNIENTSLIGSYSRVEPDFQALGAPSSTNDKESYELSTGYSIPSWASVSLYFNTYHDNLEDKTDQTTSTQNLGSMAITLQRPSYPVIALGYSLNTAIGDPDTALDNQTKTPSIAISHTFHATTLSISYQKSDFTDNTNMSDDLESTAGNLSISSRIGENISVSGGTTQSTVSNIVSSTDTNTNSYSFSFNISNIIKDKLSSALWGSSTASKDSPEQSIDTKSETGTIEFTYSIRSDMSATLGYTNTSYTDTFSDADTYTENSGNIRFSMSF
ncbi:MAG: hypothetical protein JW983_02620 [Elusimicrobia bacterium]|nr:hypothetical protein [Elusimicrobiota bacterium]